MKYNLNLTLETTLEKEELQKEIDHIIRYLQRRDVIKTAIASKMEAL